MRTTDTLVVGAGQAGLAASRLLTERGVEHVLLERGRVGERWRSTTWDSLHLLTPNWMNSLPGRPYQGADPDGFISAAAFAEELADYARSFDAPVEAETRVVSLSKSGNCFRAVTDRETWTARTAVIATGWCERPAVPAMAAAVNGDIAQLSPGEYRNPESVPPGGVLVVGASATGVQLADELRAAGRDVTIAVGRHTRVPRSYRGMDIYWWLQRLGVLDKTIDEMPDPVLARREPSLQLVGKADRGALDLAALQSGGVRVAGRLIDIDGSRASFAADLSANVAAADRRMGRLLRHIDRLIDSDGLRDEVFAAQSSQALDQPSVIRDLDLRNAGIRTIVWATGHRRSYPWLRLPVLDRNGEIRQSRGRTPVPGLYVLGQRFQHYRSSNFIGGVGRDAAFVADQITGCVAPTRDCTSAGTGH
ncbi:MAG TPA: NAD(P)/FAD-dependent oxidoreductase [Jatrophihabitans sp.]|nr:NAD(P)/FAD-dependent oxidoreductase [Jatrophihabitans sp.]